MTPVIHVHPTAGPCPVTPAPDTPTEAIRAVLLDWIEDGDECGAA